MALAWLAGSLRRALRTSSRTGAKSASASMRSSDTSSTATGSMPSRRRYRSEIRRPLASLAS
jgi:hypothetical protein